MREGWFVGGLIRKISNLLSCETFLFEQTLCGFMLHSIANSNTRTWSVFARIHVNISQHKIEGTLNWQLKQEIRFTSKIQEQKESGEHKKFESEQGKKNSFNHFHVCTQTTQTQSHILIVCRHYYLTRYLSKALICMWYMFALVCASSPYYINVSKIACFLCVKALFCKRMNCVNWMSIVSLSPALAFRFSWVK